MMIGSGSFVVKRSRQREREDGEGEGEQRGERELYVRVDGSSVVHGHVAVVRCTVGSRRGCSNAKRHHRQSGGELHGASDCGCVLCVVCCV
jgi:hypothetical protein